VKDQIDHILVSKQHRISVQDIRAMRGADVASDHELVRCKLRIKLRKHKTVKSEKRRIKYDTTKLQKPDILKAFHLELKNRFSILESNKDNTNGLIDYLRFYVPLKNFFTYMETSPLPVKGCKI
jgi:hypothetical protein